MEAAVPAGVFDLEAAVLDHRQSCINRRAGGLVVAQSELQPHRLGANGDGLIDNGWDRVLAAEHIHDVGHLGKIVE